jgi:hypothetical protein
MPQLQHLDRSVSQNKIWEVIDTEGGVIIDDFISKELLSRLQDELLPLVGGHTPGSHDGAHDFWKNFHGHETKRITGLAGRSKAWVQLLCDPLYRKMGEHYLDRNGYWLNTAQLICIGPTETPQMLHRDEGNWPSAIHPENEITITAIFALTEFSEANGATVVIPGSNQWTDLTREPTPDRMARAVMPAGAALLYGGKIIHGGGANTTQDEWRVGLHAGFCRGWLRSEENHQLTTSLEQARGMPEYVQRLLGFRSYTQPMGGRLGLVDYEDCARLL